MAYCYSSTILSQPHSRTSLFSPLTTKTPNTKTFLNPPKLTHKTNHFSIKKQTQKKPQLLCAILSNMWWANLKSSIGQRFNLEGIIFSSKILLKHPNLLLPHLKVPNIRYINWEELHKRGFKGVIFDKDNTITLPYELSLWDPLKGSIDRCKAVFGDDKVAIFSNSVGLFEFDPDESKAEVVEGEIGVRVIRHKVKKPGGGSDEIEKEFGCGRMEIVMVGDRRFTDVVFGNRNGCFTVLTDPLSVECENFVVKLVRKFEEFVVKRKCKRGLSVKEHCLLGKFDLNLVTLDDPL